MTTQMFGSPVGAQVAIEDISRMAQGRMLTAEAGMKENELAMQRKFMAGMAGIRQKQSGTPTNMADNIDDMAQLAMGAGQVDKAAALSERSAMIRSHMAQMAHTQMTMREQQVKQGKETVDLMGQFLQGATDQASWDRGNTLFAMTTGRRSPYAGLPFNPTLVEELKKQSMTAKDLSDLQMHKENLASMEEARRSAEAFRNTRANIMQQELELRKQREERAAKAGGKAVGVPGKDEQAEANALIMKEFTNLPDDERQAAAYTIASRAKALRQTNPGLDAAQALTQAFAEAKANQNFQSVDRMFGIGALSIPLGKTTHYSRPDAPWTSFQPAESEDAE